MAAPHRSLRLKQFIRYAKIAGVLYCLVAAFLAFAIETPLSDNSVYANWTLQYSAFPLACMVSVAIHWLRNEVKPFWLLVIQASCAYIFILALSVPFALAANAIGVSPTHPVTYSGVIVTKQYFDGRRDTYSIDVYDGTLHRNIRFSPSQAEYEKMAVGQTFRKTMLIGRFGLPFRWTWQKL